MSARCQTCGLPLFFWEEDECRPCFERKCDEEMLAWQSLEREAAIAAGEGLLVGEWHGHTHVLRWVPAELL